MGTFTAIPPRRGFLAAKFAVVEAVAFRGMLAFDRVTLGFSIVLLLVVSKALGAVTLAPGATFVGGIGLRGEAGWAR